jgi:hypothetical protein
MARDEGGQILLADPEGRARAKLYSDSEAAPSSSTKRAAEQ